MSLWLQSLSDKHYNMQLVEVVFLEIKLKLAYVRTLHVGFKGEKKVKTPSLSNLSVTNYQLYFFKIIFFDSLAC